MNAQVLAACLQNAGLAARVMDSDTIYANGVLFGSLTLGGVRVMVPKSQLDAALKNGVGVMLDDLLAAAYTLLVFALWQRFFG